jgi:hypothetical protein
MNTGIRRFLLRFSVGLLAFLLGVTAAWALGRFNPFQDFSGTRYYRYKRCGSHRSFASPRHAFEWRESASITEPVYLGPTEGYACKSKRAPGKSSQPVFADAPLPPIPPLAIR